MIDSSIPYDFNKLLIYKVKRKYEDLNLLLDSSNNKRKIRFSFRMETLILTEARN